MSRLLQIVGGLALVAWTGLGLAAWLLTKEQLQITFEPGSTTSRGVENPVAALTERIDGIERDLRALAAGLEQNLRILDENIEGAARRRGDQLQAALDAGLRAAAGEHDAAGLRSVEVQVAALAREVAALRESLADPARGAAAVAVPPAEPGATPASPPAPSPRDAPLASPTAPADAAPPEPRKKSFLAFRLPSDDFSFDGARRFEIIPSLSRVGFDAKSTLHDFTGATTAVRGSLRLDLGHLAQDASGTLAVDATAIDTGLLDRNTAMLEHLGADAHPEITFELTGFRPAAVDPAAMDVRGDALGKMTIRGVTREVSMPTHLSIGTSRQLTIEGEVGLSMADYGVEVPSKLGVISVDPTVKVWVALRARPLPKVGN